MGDRTNRKSNDVVEVLGQMFGKRLELEPSKGSWPITGAMVLAGTRVPVEIYPRLIGQSGRNRDEERRFQNPSKGSAITAPEHGYAMLWGVWIEQGMKRAVVTAFDAYRRIDKATRYSCFMPLGLLEEAADTGFSSFTNGTGEEVFAFRADALGRYFEAFCREASWGEYVVPSTAALVADTEPSIPDPATDESIHIRPKVGMYAAFARLNYKPWFALAEFVDNAVQSYLDNRKSLSARGVIGPLLVDVRIDDNEISITDRAGGIALADFPRAFSPSMRPPDPSGLSEFGLGMKAAACWFSKKWSVRTSALGEKTERTIEFDVPQIVRNGADDLPITARETRNDDHYTVISMRDLRVRPKGTTISKIRTHLASIYRVLIADDIVRVRLTASGQSTDLEFQPPELLVAPYHEQPNEPAQTWRAPVDIELDGKRVVGWVGILSKGKQSLAGLSIFRRKRLIQGSAGDAYRPKRIFGSSNSFAFQRVVGELHVHGFEVSHTKDGIQWQGLEEEVLEKLREQIDSKEMPLLDQAAKYRARKTGATVRRGFGKTALKGVAAELTNPQVEASLVEKVARAAEQEPAVLPLGEARVVTSTSFRLEVDDAGQSWSVDIELVDQPGAHWFSLNPRSDGAPGVSVALNLSHPFSEAHVNDNERALGPLLRVVAALAVAEHVAKQSGMKYTSRIRGDANDLLLKAFATAEIQERS